MDSWVIFPTTHIQVIPSSTLASSRASVIALQRDQVLDVLNLLRSPSQHPFVPNVLLNEFACLSASVPPRSSPNELLPGLCFLGDRSPHRALSILPEHSDGFVCSVQVECLLCIAFAFLGLQQHSLAQEPSRPPLLLRTSSTSHAHSHHHRLIIFSVIGMRQSWTVSFEVFVA